LTNNILDAAPSPPPAPEENEDELAETDEVPDLPHFSRSYLAHLARGTAAQRSWSLFLSSRTLPRCNNLHKFPVTQHHLLICVFSSARWCRKAQSSLL